MKIFFFFFYFFLPTAPRNRKKLPLTFFSRGKSFPAFKFHFLQISEITRKQHTLFYGPIMRKNRA